MKNYEMAIAPRGVWDEDNGTTTINIWSTVIPITQKTQMQINNDEYVRASQHSICKDCERKFSKHPSVEGYNWLNVLCDGTLVKL